MIHSALRYGGLCVILFFSLFPVYWIISFSVRETSELLKYPPTFFPQTITFDAFVTLFEFIDMTGYIWNTVLVSLAATAITIIVSTMGGYALARRKFAGRDAVGLMMLSSQMIPTILLVVPLSLIMQFVGLLDSHVGLVFALVGITIPVGTWMMKGFIETVPIELEEAAVLDGCEAWEVPVRVVLPLIMPGIVTVGMYTFILAWGEFVFSLTLLRSEEMRTLPSALAVNFGRTSVDYEVLMPMAVTYMAPALLIMSLFQRQLTRSIAEGALKG
ncbi:MAG: carbohydrate ABC transporter permease [Marinibacterium sp.]|nr:carbohydrate ABC transporter permease [Marinibacterium sp.]